MTKVCRKCGKPLKDKMFVRKQGAPTRGKACKSPTCVLYGKAQ